MSVSDGELRFVLLRHEMPESSQRASHYDLMLERSGDLFTLELLAALEPAVPQAGRELAPHRKAYLDFEGAVSGDRGEVRRIDRGSLRISSWAGDAIEVELHGRTIRGRLTCSRDAARQDSCSMWRVCLRAF